MTEKNLTATQSKPHGVYGHNTNTPY